MKKETNIWHDTPKPQEPPKRRVDLKPAMKDGPDEPVHGELESLDEHTIASELELGKRD